MPHEYKQFYRRNLPHIHSPGATFFLTFRLEGSIPKNVIEKWNAEKQFLEQSLERKEKSADSAETVDPQHSSPARKEFNRRWFSDFEDILHEAKTGPTWLKDLKIAKIVADSLHNLNQKRYKLHAFCIMSNHVHIVFTPYLNEQSLVEIRGSNPLRFESNDATLPKIMQSIKGYTAHEANKLLNRKGKFWQSESYDHEVRNGEEFSRIVAYVLNNPVKAGLVKNWRDWQWNWKA